MVKELDIDEMADRYQAAYDEVFAKLEGWRRAAILEDQKLGVEGRILAEFIAEVARKAETSS